MTRDVVSIRQSYRVQIFRFCLTTAASKQNEHVPPCVTMATLRPCPAWFPKTKMRHGMKNRCGLRIELCVASDDLMGTADWFWLLKLAAWWAEPPEVRCSGRRGGCLLQAVCRSFLAHARQQKRTFRSSLKTFGC